MYALSQQTKFGDNNDEKPSVWWIKETFKYNAWMKLKGMSSDEARKTFIKYAEGLLAWKRSSDSVLEQKGKDFCYEIIKQYEF